MLKLDVYTGGLNVPSARYRIRQHIPLLKQNGFKVTEHISKAGVYPPRERWKRLLWSIHNLSENFISTIESYTSDVVFLQREMLSTFTTYEGFLKHPIIFDVDDAIHLYRKGGYTRKIAQNMDGIICGNEYLAEWYAQYNKNVIVIPTAVDIAMYEAQQVKRDDDTVNILWSGTSSGFKFLYSIEDALLEVLKRNPEARLKVVSDQVPIFKSISKQLVIYEKWNELNEFSSIKHADIGIMPIYDDEWSKGKCSYKMLCYMAARLPVVVSPFGMNKMVLTQGELGFGAINSKQWIESLDALIKSPNLRKSYGEEGYRVASHYYDTRIIGSKISEFIKKLI